MYNKKINKRRQIRTLQTVQILSDDHICLGTCEVNLLLVEGRDLYPLALLNFKFIILQVQQSGGINKKSDSGPYLVLLVLTKEMDDSNREDAEGSENKE